MAQKKKETQKDKKVKDLLSQLASKDENVQLNAVKSLKVHGNESVIEPLVKVMTYTESEAIKAEIIDLLNTIKSTKVPAHIIKCIENDEYVASHQILLSSIWNSGLDYRPFMGEIAAATVKGDFMYAMECITILENLEGGLTEEQIMEALIVFQGYLSDKKEGDDTKNGLITEIVLTLQSMNDSV